MNYKSVIELEKQLMLLPPSKDKDSILVWCLAIRMLKQQKFEPYLFLGK